MGEQCQIRSRSCNRMPTKRCTANGRMNEFIVVDDDEVIILDFPESSKAKAPKTSRTRNEPVWQRVISLDDDDVDDTENVHKAGSSSSRKSLAANLQTSAEVDNDDYQSMQEESATFRFSKCNQTFSTMPSPGIRLGLGSESDSDFSESDCSDCEILEGSDREVREQWEKAVLKKMKKAGKAGLSEETGPSNLHCDANIGSGFESRTVQHVEEQPDTVQVQCETTQWPKESQMKKAAKENHKKKAAEQSYTKEVVEEEDALKSSLPQTSDGDDDTPPVLGVSNGARYERGFSSLGESREPIINPIPSTSAHVQGLQGTAPGIDIMLKREMLKETYEYKKAQEEEWESRQRQLQLQAEEAQRQRKRKKLANTRQLEMERRQKERVEEVRETQKKDEESMNMKEKVRAEITKSLKLLELKCINMASLLRGLGIPVGGGISPLPHEVHAAYRRAVLKFHPDRASGGDIKLQVEAEEKFKLIARMKDKFLS